MSASRAFAVTLLVMSATVLLTPAAAAVPAGILEPMPADSSTVPCAAGTTALGSVQGSSGGTPTMVDLCGLPNLRTQPGDPESNPSNGRYYVSGASGHAMVNARISKQAFRMLEAARTAGVTLVATSSFRRQEHQKALYECYLARGSGCNRAEPPGYSNHQTGLAIDFALTRPGDGCSDGTAQDDPQWKWLNDHAGEFGFRQRYAENWHWEASTSSTLTC